MFDYFRNYSSNAHQVCCEDSPDKGLYDHCQSDDLDHQSRSQVRLKRDFFLNLAKDEINVPIALSAFRDKCFFLKLAIPEHYLSYYIQTWHGGRLMDAT